MQTRGDEHPTRAAAFPAEAVSWLVGRSRRTVVSIAQRDLAVAVAAAGHHVAAVTARAPLPFPGSTIDTVVAADQLPSDLEAVADLLRPGGQLTLVCSRRDHRIPWVRKLDQLLGAGSPAANPEHDLVWSSRFGPVEEQTFRWWQVVNHESLAAMLEAELAGLARSTREAKVAQALELYAEYGRGNDGMQMPWVSRCFRATVSDPIWATAPVAEDHDQDTAERDDAVLLIDFR